MDDRGYGARARTLTLYLTLTLTPHPPLAVTEKWVGRRSSARRRPAN